MPPSWPLIIGPHVTVGRWKLAALITWTVTVSDAWPPKPSSAVSVNTRSLLPVGPAEGAVNITVSWSGVDNWTLSPEV
ncbi:MAG: hypothetical protein E6K98_06770 [Thaumarchaeota archaeon]|nr:MAG: hypothetical protein E6K98_06770 [Nitrososphaerota archaeon]